MLRGQRPDVKKKKTKKGKKEGEGSTLERKRSHLQKTKQIMKARVLGKEEGGDGQGGIPRPLQPWRD